MIKILLAEDHQIVRYGLKNLLEGAGSFEVIGEASNGRDALQLIDEGMFPDIILTDINMPEMSGIELAENLKQNGKQQIKVVILTMLENEKFILHALKLGVHGYLLKSVGSNELLFALSHVYQDNRYICSELAVRMLNRNNAKINDCEGIDFSKRETEVLSLIAHGHTNKEIADKLYTSRRTIEGHRQAMINKAKVRNSAELIRFAVKHSLID